MHDELTEIDIKKMQEEIDYRIIELTPKLKAELQQARELGDLSENDEYRTTRRELNVNYSRIRYLKNMINTAVIIKVDTRAEPENTIGLFDKITLKYDDDDEEQVISIVTTLRSDPLKGFISKESPFGRALIGRQCGERVKIDANEKLSYYVEIIKIEKGEDDDSLEINKY